MISPPHYHLLLDPAITESIIHSHIFSQFSWIGLLFVIGTLLAEYTVSGSTGHDKNNEMVQRIKRKRQTIWFLFFMFLVFVII